MADNGGNMLKLSEAVREGAKWPDGKPFSFFDLSVTPPGCCALGGAALAVGEIPDGPLSFPCSRMFETFPILTMKLKDPVSCRTDDAMQLISDLYEAHKWSKKAISEWLEVEERKLGLWDEPKADPPVVTEAIKASLVPASRP